VKKLDAEMSSGAAPARPPMRPREEKKDDKPTTPAVSPAESSHKFAKYYLPRSWSAGALHAGQAEHDKIAKVAIDIYNDYNLQYDRFPGFEAAIDMSEAYLEIHDEENAAVALESALAIEKAYAGNYDPLHPAIPRLPSSSTSRRSTCSRARPSRRQAPEAEARVEEGPLHVRQGLHRRRGRRQAVEEPRGKDQAPIVSAEWIKGRSRWR